MLRSIAGIGSKLFVAVAGAGLGLVCAAMSVDAQTATEIQAMVRDAVDRGDFPVAISRLGWLISVLEDPRERAEYEGYRDRLIAFDATLSDIDRIYLQMSGAGRELAKQHLGGESAYLAAIAGATPALDDDPLLAACLEELHERRNAFARLIGDPERYENEPLRFTSPPLIVELDPGVYNLAGVVSGPELGELTRRWRYHCMLRHGESEIEVLVANIWQ